MTGSNANRPQTAGAAKESARLARWNAEESPLTWLASRKDKNGRPLISREQFEAGERLRRDFTFALLGPRVTASWSAVPSDPSSRRGAGNCAHDLADNVIAARERFNRALVAVGPDLSAILVDVCCYLKGLETCEKASGWPQRSAKIVLVIALQHLARHYGMLRQDPLREKPSPRIRHWGGEGYRPTIDGGASDE